MNLKTYGMQAGEIHQMSRTFIEVLKERQFVIPFISSDIPVSHLYQVGKKILGKKNSPLPPNVSSISYLFDYSQHQQILMRFSFGI